MRRRHDGRIDIDGRDRPGVSDHPFQWPGGLSIPSIRSMGVGGGSPTRSIRSGGVRVIFEGAEALWASPPGQPPIPRPQNHRGRAPTHSRRQHAPLLDEGGHALGGHAGGGAEAHGRRARSGEIRCGGGGGLCGRGWTWSARDRASVSSKTRGGSICVRWSSQAWVQGQKTNRSPTPRAEGRESKQSNQEAATCKWWRMMLHLRRTRWNTRRGRGVPRFAPPTDPHKQAEQRE